MKIDYKQNTAIIKDTESNSVLFLEKLTKNYPSLEKYNLILDLSHDKSIDLENIKTYLPLAKKHKNQKKSFVLVATNIDYNKTPTNLLVVPTLLEAQDMVDIEEIERDLGF